MIIQKHNSLFIDTSDYKEIVLILEKIKRGVDEVNDELKKTENSVLLVDTLDKKIKRTFTDIETTENKIEEIIRKSMSN